VIIHFLQIWLLVAVTFVCGCLIGAWLYSVIAESRLALAQGAIADTIGDGLDRLKSTFGIGPSWRAEHLKSVPRLLPTIAAAEPSWAGRSQSRIDRVMRLSPPPADEVVEAARWPDDLDRTQEPAFTGGDPMRIEHAETVSNDGIVPRRPPGIAAPRSGVPDNLTRIRGIGFRNETALNKIGIYHFSQIAAWTPAEVRWIGQYLAFPERIERDDWAGQAAVLAVGGDTGFEKAADRRRRRRQALHEGGSVEEGDDAGDDDEQ